ncbi:MAG TPA: DinB family protein [Solirubrobacterales bacterium]|nr:DinB family protein [Solirubrobacterales bacterium]
MTKDKDLKRRTRKRSERTGERYAAARAQLVDGAGGEGEAALAITRQELLVGPVEGWWKDFRPALDDLGEAEYHWAAAPGCLSVRRRGDRVVRDRPDQLGAPLATIAWQVGAMTALLELRFAAHFDDRRLAWDAVTVAYDPAAGIAALDAAHASWAAAVAAMAPADLLRMSEGPPRMIDGQFPFIQVVLHTSQLLQAAAVRIEMIRALHP